MSKFHMQVAFHISVLIYVLEFVFWVVIEKWEQRKRKRIAKENKEREREKEREECRKFLEELAWSNREFRFVWVYKAYL